MKYVFIALFILCFNISVAMINSLGITGIQDVYNSEWFGELNQTATNQLTYSPSVGSQDDTIRSTGDLAKGVSITGKALIRSIVDVPFTFQLLAVPYSLALLLSIPIYLFYLLALAQLVIRFRLEN